MKRTWVILAIVFLVASTVNLASAILLFEPYTAMPRRSVVNVFGPEAVVHQWPARTPHPIPWPPLTQWVLTTSMGRTQIQATHAENGQATHQMQAYIYGWPFPVMQRTMLWWPDSDPAWTLSAPHETGLQLCLSGFILNPLMATVAVWLLLIAPVAATRAITQRRRLKRSQCPACGYPTGVSDRCTECGAMLPARPVAKAS